MEPLDRKPPELSLDARLELDAASPRSRRFRIVAVLAVGVVLVMLLPLLGSEDREAGFLTVPAERGSLRVTVIATGELEPVNQVDVGTEVSGTIAVVAVDYNEPVTRGQVLARLDTDELEAQVVQARANMKAAEARVMQSTATVEEARLKHGRCEALARKAMCSQDQLDSAYASLQRATADLASVEAQVEVARATLDGHQTRLDKAEIRSPIDGVVLDRLIEPGQTVAASLQTPVLFVIAEDLRDMELHVDVDEADIGRVSEGQEATFTVDAYVERQFPAHITQVRFAPDSESGVVTYETILRVDNQQLLLRPGMTATAEIVVAELADALLVPNAALRFEPPAEPLEEATHRPFLERLVPHRPRRDRSRREPGSGAGEQTVWTLKDGVPHEVAVQAGLNDGVQTAVSGALAAGDAVITGIELPGDGR